MPTPAIEFANVFYQAGSRDQSRPILQDISLQLEQGTTTALLGRSGSGKTTLLRTVNALVQPTSGQILLEGRPNSQRDLTELRRSIGYAIQETGLFPHMTVERNATLALELAGTRNNAARAAELLQLTGLDPSLAERYPWQLSGGQRQRVGLARALALDPAVLLLDEPFGALDPITRAEIQTTLRELLARLKKTVLLVTHDLDEALYLAHRVIFLDQGKVIADLKSKDVLSSENPQVQTYVTAVHRASANPQPPTLDH